MNGRACRECTLCCKLLPVRELGKAASIPCSHQRTGKGCTIYARRPFSCSIWSCGWLIDEDGGALARPDHSHYIIDPSPDYVEIRYDDGRQTERLGVVQVWVDPRFPHAHRDPALRDWLERRAFKTQQAGLIRIGSCDAFVLFPPSMCEDGQWHEKAGGGMKEHSMAEILQTYGRFKTLAERS